MIRLHGMELVSTVERKPRQAGGEYAIITLGNGLRITTFSESAIVQAETALAHGVMLSFWGVVKPRVWEGKTFTDLNVDNATALTVDVLQASLDKGATDLPF